MPADGGTIGGRACARQRGRLAIWRRLPHWGKMCATEGNNGPLSVLTIGHSNTTLAHLVAMLQTHGVQLLADTRSQPHSRVAPHFSRHSLEGSLRKVGIGYRFMGDELGGRPQQSECYVDGKVDYDRVEEQAFYQEGIQQLVDAIQRLRACILCAEEDPTECHRRRLVGRTLLRRGIQVCHIRGDGAIELVSAVQARFERKHPMLAQLSFVSGDL